MLACTLPERILKALALAHGQAESTSMTDKLLLVVCAILIAFGILFTALSSGFFMNLLAAGIMGSGGAVAYLILSHRVPGTDKRVDLPAGETRHRAF